jgi:hypothetical protein
MLIRYLIALTWLIGGVYAQEVSAATPVTLSCDVTNSSPAGPVPYGTRSSNGLTIDFDSKVIDGDLYSIARLYDIPFKAQDNIISLVSDKQVIAHFYWRDPRTTEWVLTTILDRHNGDVFVVSHHRDVKSGTQPFFVLEGQCSPSKRLF